VEPPDPTVIEPLVAELRSIVGDDLVSVHPDGRRHASRDHAWMSPILRDRLDDLPIADLVVLPGTRDELAAVVGACHRARVPLTARGRGTGNYGQGIPLAAGVLLDTTRLDTIVDVGDGAVTAEAGVSFLALEAEARRHGQELAVFPTTTGSALGGFLAGGAGGVGSVEHGLLWDGAVLGVEVLPYVDDPAARWVDGPAALAHVHTYGTTGVIAAARVRLEPARTWWSLWASFPTFDAARRAGEELMRLDPVPRLISVDDPELWGLYPADRAFREGAFSLRAVVAVTTASEVESLVASHGGAVDAMREGQTSQLSGLAFDHVTLRAQRNEPSLCHVQVGGSVLVEEPERVRACLPSGRIHLDAIAHRGEPGWDGLLLSEFVDEPTLRRGMAELRELGVHVTDPHSWALESTGPIEAAAAEFDPDGLLNPGKLVRR
jgi:FAD/FMN-containing dehydrogenase